MKGQCADRVFVASGRQVLKVGGTILVAGTSREDLERRSKAESAGLVFTMESGTAVDPRSALRPISTAAKALGMSGVGMHTLRHSFATDMLAAGVPLHTVSGLLGHSFVAVTGDVHGHVADQGARFAVRRLSAAMGW